MSKVEPRVLVNRHSGERLTLRRVKRNGEIWLEMVGATPPMQSGPPMHIHLAEIEDVKVARGTLSAIVDGKQITAAAGESAVFPAGVAHRWWNGHDEPLELAGYAHPVADLDVYLQALFDVINAGPTERPPLFYVAHAAWRHRATQRLAIGPAWVQSIVFPAIIAIGTVLGKYQGTDWPGCPARCGPAPFCPES
jgi:mannose-6-phosphate isomerase-like protein (cupin superfamily)